LQGKRKDLRVAFIWQLRTSLEAVPAIGEGYSGHILWHIRTKTFFMLSFIAHKICANDGGDYEECGSWKNRRFGGTYRLIISVKKISELGIQQLSS
jgi:hypothetical protein